MFLLVYFGEDASVCGLQLNNRNHAGSIFWKESLINTKLSLVYGQLQYWEVSPPHTLQTPSAERVSGPKASVCSSSQQVAAKKFQPPEVRNWNVPMQWTFASYLSSIPWWSYKQIFPQGPNWRPEPQIISPPLLLCQQGMSVKLTINEWPHFTAFLRMRGPETSMCESWGRSRAGQAVLVWWIQFGK